jgi:SAM-dependent methyltransferase
MSREGTTSFVQLLRERRSRDAIYHAASYWDSRARARQGLARSIWPSNAFNALWDERQREVLVRSLGSLSGRRFVDIGCGTGRMTRFFYEAGAAEAVGVDFSDATVEAARVEQGEAIERGAPMRFVVGNVLDRLDHVGAGAFDDAVILGCFSVACRSKADLYAAFRNVASLVRGGGRVTVFEPIHRSPLLRRVLDLGIEDWIAAANRAGLVLGGADRMGFAPVRLALSVRELPPPLLKVPFNLGERVLDRAPWLAPLADYKLLWFLRAT